MKKLLLLSAVILAGCFPSSGSSWLTPRIHNPVLVYPIAVQDSGNGVVFKDKLYIIGGLADREHERTNEVWTSPDGHRWENMLVHSNLGTNTQFSPRYGHQAVEWKGELWLVGGDTGVPNDFSSIVWRSPDGVIWNRVPTNLTFNIAFHQLVATSNKLIFTGGRKYPDTGSYSNETWESSNGTDWYRIQNNAPFEGMVNHAMAAGYSHIYLFGGTEKDASAFSNMLYASSINDGLNKWTAMPGLNAPIDRDSHRMVFWKGNLWLIGGHYQKDGKERRLNDVWVYDLHAERWMQRLPDGHAQFARRSNFQMYVKDNELWITGGVGDDGKRLNSSAHTSDGYNWVE